VVRFSLASRASRNGSSSRRRPKHVFGGSCGSVSFSRWQSAAEMTVTRRREAARSLRDAPSPRGRHLQPIVLQRKLAESPPHLGKRAKRGRGQGDASR
jgi:hypothetical protein